MVTDRSSTTPGQVTQGCPICGRTSLKRLFDKNSYPVMLCRHCKAEFLHPQPDDETLAAIYSHEYFIGAGDQAMDARVSELKQQTAALYLDSIGEMKTTGSRAVLEIGCGHGDLLFEAQRRGYEVAGVEFSPFAVAKANARLGAELVRAGSIEQADLPANYFDFVVAADVVEHVRDPKQFLLHVRKLLRPSGAVILITPSLDSLTRRLMKSRWMEYKTEHLFYFGRHSMEYLLSECGFEKIAVRQNKKILSLEYVEQHFAKFPVPVVTPSLRTLTGVLPKRWTRARHLVNASGMFVTAYRTNGKQSV